MSDERRFTRRDVLRGRFLRSIRERSPDADRAGRATGMTRGETTGPDPAQPVMRYPRSSVDVRIGDADRSKPTPSSARRRTIPVLRPPGAIDEPTFLAECTRCEKCIEACPHDAIRQAPERFRSAAGTPILDGDRSPCRMCADLPCIDACEPAVLTRAIPLEMGTAKIVAQTCLAHRGTTCTACSEQCPVEGAISVAAGRPRVDEDVCTGCGVCRFVCPAPENAILLMPSFSRPPRPPREAL